MNYLLSILMAMAAYSCLSGGFVLMKKGVSWIGWGKKKNSLYYKNLILWISGFIIMNIYGVPSAVALKYLPAHIVAAFAGWGIVVLVFLSYIFLKEKLHNSDYIFSLLIIIGIFILNFFRKDIYREIINIHGIVILILIPIILFFLGFNRKLSATLKTLVYGSVSGASAGLMVISLKILVLKHQYHVMEYFNSAYMYIYVIYALISFIALQFAFKHGPMMIIGPAQYSTNIIYPLLAAFLVFCQRITVIQIITIGVIIFSVIGIMRKR